MFPNRTRRRDAGFASALVFLLLCLLQPVTVAAQDGGYQGRAFERLPDGGIGSPIPNAAVQFIAEDGNLAGSATTDGNGSYRIPLPPGRYQTTAKASGYETHSSGDGYSVLREGEGYQTRNFFLVAGGGTPSGEGETADPPAGSGENSEGTVGGSVEAASGAKRFRLNFSAQGEPLEGRIRYAPRRGAAMTGDVNVCFRRSGSRVALAGELSGDAPAPYFEVVLEDNGPPGDSPDRADFRTSSTRPDCDTGEAPAHVIERGNVDLQP